MAIVRLKKTVEPTEKEYQKELYHMLYGDDMIFLQVWVDVSFSDIEEGFTITEVNGLAWNMLDKLFEANLSSILYSEIFKSRCSEYAEEQEEELRKAREDDQWRRELGNQTFL